WVSPFSTATADLGTPSAFASTCSMAALALPFSGTARTRTLRNRWPAASSPTPSIASLDAPGWARTRSSAPPATSRQHPATSDHVEIDVVDQHLPRQDDQQDQDQRREIQSVDRPDDAAYRLQQRLGH